MPKNNRQSSIDKHADRAEIEALLCRRVPLRKLSARFGMDIAALSRHRKRMKEQRPKAYAALEATDWSCTVDELERIKTETSQGFIIKLKSQIDKMVKAQDAALEDDRFASAAQLAGQAFAGLRMLGEFTGGLGDGSARININNSTNIAYTTEFHELRATIIGALRPFPEALRAVLHALKGEQTPDGGGSLTFLPLPVLVETQTT